MPGNLVRIAADDVPLELIGPLDCGLQTGTGGVMRSLACPAGSTIAIFDGGPVGLAAVMGAVVQDCETIILVEPFAPRRDMALSLGATPAGDVGAAIRAILPDGVEFAFETSGRETVWRSPSPLFPATACSDWSACRSVPRAACRSILPHSSLTATASTASTASSRGDSDLDTFILQLVELYRTGRFPFDRPIRTFPLDRINEALAAQLSGKLRRK